LDLNASQLEDRAQGGEVLDHGDVEISPRVRRYTRPADDFSPYWDAWVSGFYSRDHDSTAEVWSAGVGAGFDLGAEYFTRWHFSIAAHSGLLSASWLERHFEEPPTILGPSSTVTDRETVSLGLNPGFVLRTYF
jgi:hypothetical protein